MFIDSRPGGIYPIYYFINIITTTLISFEITRFGFYYRSFCLLELGKKYAKTMKTLNVFQVFFEREMFIQ